MKDFILIAIILVVISIGFYFGFKFLSNADFSNKSGLEAASVPTPAASNKKMEIFTLKEGEGEGAKAGDSITVDYVGTLEDGTKFDSSIDAKQPFTFTLGEHKVIQGWDEGLIGAKLGEKRKLVIPPEMAYGEAGAGDKIPPNSTLIFEVDVLAIKPEASK